MDVINDYLDSYCYGPADILKICPGDHSLLLNLMDSTGHLYWAIYEDCIYRQLPANRQHLSMVRRVQPVELQSPGILECLQKNTDHVQKLLNIWMQQGYSLFLHMGSRPDSDFLVVAKKLKLK